MALYLSRRTPISSACANNRPPVVHYRIRRTHHGELYIADDDRRHFVGLSELVAYFRLNRGRLPTRLCSRRRRRRSGGVGDTSPPRPGSYYDVTLELERRRIQLSSRVVRRTSTSTTWSATYHPPTHGLSVCLSHLSRVLRDRATSFPLTMLGVVLGCNL